MMNSMLSIEYDVFGWVIVSYHRLPFPGSNYNLCVSYLDNMSDKQKFDRSLFIFQFIVTIIYSGCFVF